MKRLITLVVVAAFGFGLAGCKKSPEQLAEEFIKLFEQVADTVDKNKGDCKKMASEVSALLEKSKKLIEEAKAMKGKMKPEDNKKFEEKFKPRMQAAMKKMMPAMMKCATNKDFQQAMKKLKM